MNKDFPYNDILPLPHHVSENHPPMSREKRAAQFAPFAALTGYGDAVAETARRTERRIESDEGGMALLDMQLRELLQNGGEAAITYFVPDEKKAGGAYVTVRGGIRRYDELTHTLLLSTGTRIAVTDIVGLDSISFPVDENGKKE